MRKTIALALFLISLPEFSFAEDSLSSLPPRISRENFNIYMASVMVAGLYCDGVELNADYISGFLDATGSTPPFLDRKYREEFDRREKEAKEVPDGYCKLAFVMFHKDIKPKALLAPLLVSKPGNKAIAR